MSVLHLTSRLGWLQVNMCFGVFSSFYSLNFRFILTQNLYSCVRVEHNLFLRWRTSSFWHFSSFKRWGKLVEITKAIKHQSDEQVWPSIKKKVIGSGHSCGTPHPERLFVNFLFLHYLALFSVLHEVQNMSNSFWRFWQIKNPEPPLSELVTLQK